MLRFWPTFATLLCRRAECREVFFTRVFPGVLTVRETCLVLVFAGYFFVDSQEHFLADRGLELERLVLWYGLPVADSTRFYGLGLSPGSEHDVRCGVFGVDLSAWVCWCDSGGPNAGFLICKSSHFPSLLGTNAADFLHD
jgi:hypothetical protein